MEISISLDDPLPQFEQLIEQIKAAVTAGKLKPGAPLPSIRQLANELDINNKTVAKAYKLLERDNVIQARGYRGTFIHPHAKANCKVDLQGLIRSRLGEAIDELRSCGATDSEIRNAFSACMQNRSSLEGRKAS